MFFIILFFFLFPLRLYPGNYDSSFVYQINRSHIIFNAMRISAGVTMISTLPYFIIDDSLPLVYKNAAYYIFPPGLALNALSYGSWLKTDVSYFYRGTVSDPLASYHNVLSVMKNEIDMSKVLGSAGVNTLLLVFGLILMDKGNASSTDIRQNALYSTGLGLTVHSSVLLSLDVAELIIRLHRKDKVHKAWIRMNI